MAKKKTTKKKKTAKKKSTKKKAKKKAAKKKNWYEYKDEQRGKPDEKLLAKYGVRTCMLCNKAIKNLTEFEQHLHEEHETTKKEHDRMFPSQAMAFAPIDQAVSGNQMYRAFLYRMVNGRWPDWYKADNKVEIDSADPTLMRAAANMLLTYQMHRLGPAMEFSVISMRRLFEAGDAATMPLQDLISLARVAEQNIKEGTAAIHALADVLASIAPKEPKGAGPTVQMGFVAAGTIEAGDTAGTEERRQIEQRKHHGIAAVSEMTQQIQGFLQSGPENGPDVPSKVDPPKVIDVEVSSAETRSRQAGSGDAKKSPRPGDNGSP